MSKQTSSLSPLLERLQTTFWNRFVATASAENEGVDTVTSNFEMAQGFASIVALDTRGFFSPKSVMPYQFSEAQQSLHGVWQRYRSYTFERHVNQCINSPRLAAFAKRASTRQEDASQQSSLFLRSVMDVSSMMALEGGTNSHEAAAAVVLATGIRLCAGGASGGSISPSATWLSETVFGQQTASEDDNDNKTSRKSWWIRAEEMKPAQYTLLTASALEHALHDHQRYPLVLQSLVASIHAHWLADVKATLAFLQPSISSSTSAAILPPRSLFWNDGYHPDAQQCIYRLFRKWLDVLTLLLPAVETVRTRSSTCGSGDGFGLKELVAELCDFLQRLVPATSAPTGVGESEKKPEGTTLKGKVTAARKFTDYAPQPSNASASLGSASVPKGDEDEEEDVKQSSSTSDNTSASPHDMFYRLVRAAMTSDDFCELVEHELLQNHNNDDDHEAVSYDDEGPGGSEGRGGAVAMLASTVSLPRRFCLFKVDETLASLSFLTQTSATLSSSDTTTTDHLVSLVKSLQDVVRRALQAHGGNSSSNTHLQRAVRHSAERMYILSTGDFYFLMQGLKFRSGVEKMLVETAEGMLTPTLLKALSLLASPDLNCDAEGEALFYVKHCGEIITTIAKSDQSPPTKVGFQVIGLALLGAVGSARRIANDNDAAAQVAAELNRIVNVCLGLNARELATTGIWPVLATFSENIWRSLRCSLLDREKLGWLARHIASGLKESGIITEALNEASRLRNGYVAEALIKVLFALKEVGDQEKKRLARAEREMTKLLNGGDGVKSLLLSNQIDDILAPERDQAIVYFSEIISSPRSPSSARITISNQSAQQHLLLCCPAFLASAQSPLLRRKGIAAAFLCGDPASHRLSASTTAAWYPEDSSDSRLVEAALSVLVKPMADRQVNGGTMAQHAPPRAVSERLPVIRLILSLINARSSVPPRMLTRVCQIARLELILPPSSSVSSSALAEQAAAAALELLLVACRKNLHLLCGTRSGDRGADPASTTFRTVYQTLSDILASSRKCRLSGTSRRVQAIAIGAHTKIVRRLLQLWLDGAKDLVQRDLAAEWHFSPEDAVNILATIMTGIAEVAVAQLAPLCNGSPPVTGEDPSLSTTQGVLSVLVLAADALAKSVSECSDTCNNGGSEATDEEAHAAIQLSTISRVMSIRVHVGQLMQVPVSDVIVRGLLEQVNTTMDGLVQSLLNQLKRRHEREGRLEAADDQEVAILALCDEVASAAELSVKHGLVHALSQPVETLLGSLRQILHSSPLQQPSGALQQQPHLEEEVDDNGEILAVSRGDVIEKIDRLLSKHDKVISPSAAAAASSPQGLEDEDEEEFADTLLASVDEDVQSIDVASLFAELPRALRRHRLADPERTYNRAGRKVVALLNGMNLETLTTRAAAGLRSDGDHEKQVDAVTVIVSLIKKLPKGSVLRHDLVLALGKFVEGEFAVTEGKITGAGDSLSPIEWARRQAARADDMPARNKVVIGAHPPFSLLMQAVRLLRLQLQTNLRATSSHPQMEVVALALRVGALAAKTIFLPWRSVVVQKEIGLATLDAATQYLRLHGVQFAPSLPIARTEACTAAAVGSAGLLALVEFIELFTQVAMSLDCNRLIPRVPMNVLQDFQIERTDDVIIHELLDLLATTTMTKCSTSSLTRGDQQEVMQQLAFYFLRRLSFQISQLTNFVDGTRRNLLLMNSRDEPLQQLVEVEEKVVAPAIQAAMRKVLVLRGRDEHFVIGASIGAAWNTLGKSVQLVGEIDASFSSSSSQDAAGKKKLIGDVSLPEHTCLTKVLSPRFLTTDGVLLLQSGFRCAQSCCASLLIHLLRALKSDEVQELQALLVAMHDILRFTSPRNVAAVRYCDVLCEWVVSFVRFAHEGRLAGVAGGSTTVPDHLRLRAISLCAQLEPKLALVVSASSSSSSVTGSISSSGGSSLAPVCDKVILQSVAVLLRGDANIRDEFRLGMIVALVESRPQFFGESIKGALAAYHQSSNNNGSSSSSLGDKSSGTTQIEDQAHAPALVARIPFAKVLNTMHRAVHEQHKRAEALREQEAAQVKSMSMTPAERAASAAQLLDEDRAKGPDNLNVKGYKDHAQMLPEAIIGHLHLSFLELCSLGLQLAFTDTEAAASRRGRGKALGGTPLSVDDDAQLPLAHKMVNRAIAASMRQLFFSLVIHMAPRISHPPDLADLVTVLRISDSTWRLQRKVDDALVLVQQAVASRAEQLCHVLGTRRNKIAKVPSDDAFMRRILVEIKERLSSEEENTQRKRRKRHEVRHRSASRTH